MLRQVPGGALDGREPKTRGRISRCDSRLYVPKDSLAELNTQCEAAEVAVGNCNRRGGRKGREIEAAARTDGNDTF